ncbi:MAG: hypothetical protein A4E48_02287 [Methanosaeta sp. PtaU1.Bin060]|nr:MAG: hypothetical protein A4E48_02287 [Methanosaeta sp. PtaU1.Bin060]
MRRVLIVLMLLMMLAAPCLALTDYQKGILEGFTRGWTLAQRYDQAQTGDPTSYNQAVPKYNEWVASIFGQNSSVMPALEVIKTASQSQPYTASKTVGPVHAIDASWNQTKSVMPEPDAYGMIGGLPAETYYSVGPAIYNF